MSGYEQDFYGWTGEQARALRKRRPQDLDWEHLAEELDSMGGRERRQMESRVRIILIHLLKWRFQAPLRSRSWSNTIRVQRRDLEKHLRNNPSLRPELDQAIAEEYQDALLLALNETGLPDGTFPASCPFTAEQLLDQEYLPD